MKPHQEKVPDGRQEVPGALFVAWAKGIPVFAHDLQAIFDKMTAPLMSSSPPDGTDFAHSLLRDKGNVGQQSEVVSGSEEVVVLRLTRMARTPQVAELFLHSPVLERCRRRVKNMGCDVSPSWADGAKILVPGIQQEDLQEHGVNLCDYHVIVYKSEVQLVREAFASMACRSRPRLAQEKGLGRRKRPSATDREEPDFVEVCCWRTDSSFEPKSETVEC